MSEAVLALGDVGATRAYGILNVDAGDLLRIQIQVSRVVVSTRGVVPVCFRCYGCSFSFFVFSSFCCSCLFCCYLSFSLLLLSLLLPLQLRLCPHRGCGHGGNRFL